ncbi:MAG: hypothetical protein KW788_01730 [Candidatus Doudnabacteria bacterium]|nr:hypothetical protein [Candidatus Doudnabacteria bacterium]
MRQARWCMMVAVLVSISCGRTPSRYLGRDHRQALSVAHGQKFISISFDKNDGSTDKDITYLAADGYVYTQEFRDVSPLEGIIRWVPANEDESFLRTRALSRWTGEPVNLRLPEDCREILGVDVGFETKSTKTKNLTFLSTDGKIYSKEYRDGILNRNFEGWLEITLNK